MNGTKRRFLSFLTVALLALLVAGPVAADQGDGGKGSGQADQGLSQGRGEPQFVPHQFIVQLTDGASQADAQSLGASWSKPIRFANGLTFLSLGYPEGSDDSATLAALRSNRLVKAVSRNAKVYAVGEAPVPAPGTVGNNAGPQGDGTANAPSGPKQAFQPSASGGPQPQVPVNLCVWWPRYAGDLPPYANLVPFGINAFDVVDLVPATLVNCDVIYVGRGAYYVHTGAGFMDIDAVEAWIAAGGGVIGESESVISDSTCTLGNDWSPRLSDEHGVWSTQPDCGDWAWGAMTVQITNPGHPIAQGLPPAWNVGVYSGEDYAYIDLAKNPTAVEVARISDHGNPPVIAAEKGSGRAVYFPYAPDGGTDWGSPPGLLLQQLFINAVLWAAGGGGPQPPACLTPNDPLFPQQWGLNNTGQTGGTPDADIDACEAWATSTGAGGVVVAVVDTGIQMGQTYNGVTHPDLQPNLFCVPGEIPGNLIDDDLNGYVDDACGWDFVNESPTVYLGIDTHGTHTAGTVGAKGNNAEGVVGVHWTGFILPMKFLQSGSGTLGDALEVFAYLDNLAAIHGLRIISSNSWACFDDYVGCGGALFEAAFAASPLLHVFAAGNNIGWDNDNAPGVAAYPASLPNPNIISVAATDHNDNLAGFSNIGANTVDLAAPGVNILSTVPTEFGSYDSYQGTSMATPHVAGAAALLWNLYPGLLPFSVVGQGAPTADPAQLPPCGAPVESVKDLLMLTVDHKPALAGKMVTGGRLNLNNAVHCMAPPIVTADANPKFGPAPLLVNFTATAADPAGLGPRSIVSTSWDFGDGSPTDPNPNTTHTYLADGNYTATFTATDDQGNSSSASVNIVVATLGPGTVLFVDGDRGDTLEGFFEAAFVAAGIPYIKVEPPVPIGPAVAPSMHIAAVVWNVGYNYQLPAMTQADKDWIAAYLNHGGGVYLSAQDYIWTEGLDLFLQQYFWVANATQDTETASILGIGGNPISCGINTPLAFPFSDYSDTITPFAPAEPVFLGPDSLPRAVMYAGLGYKTVFTAFPFEAMPGMGPDPNNAPTLMWRIVNWLLDGPSPCADPEIDVNPLVIEMNLMQGQVVSAPLNIANLGAAPLDFNISEAPGVMVEPPAPRSAIGSGPSASAAAPANERATVRIPKSVLLTPTIISPTQLHILVVDTLYGGGGGSPVPPLLTPFPDLAVVDFFDGYTGTPTLAQLLGYDAVVVASDYWWADRMAMGNVLADYVDAGGSVLQMNSSYDADDGWGLAGRWRDQAYGALQSVPDYDFSPRSLGAFDAGHPIMAGVSALGGTLIFNTAQAPDAQWVADWNDGLDLVATRQPGGGCITGINAFPLDGYWTGDLPLMMHNALVFCTGWQPFDAPWLSVNPTQGTVQPGQSTQAQVTFDTTVNIAALPPGSYDAYLVIHNNDFDEDPTLVHAILHVQACTPGLDCPKIAVDPLSFNFSMPPGNTDSQTMHVSNIGDPGSQLQWKTEYNAFIMGMGTSDFGGPDAFGYTFRDSDQGGPPYVPDDISGVGTLLPLGDDDFATIPLPLDFFVYYGQLVNGGSPVTISSNGFITFQEAGADIPNNLPIPDGTLPNAMIAPLWDDLDPSAPGAAVYHHFFPGVPNISPPRFVVQWNKVPKKGVPGSSLTFQVRLNPGGGIDFQYLELAGDSTGASIGIEDWNGSVGLQVVHNAPYIHNQLRVGLRHWLSIGPVAGIVPAGVAATQDVKIRVNTGNLPTGMYHADLKIQSNDPLNPVVVVPIHLEVVQACLLHYDPQGFNASMPPDFQYTFAMKIGNTGNLVCNWSLAENPDKPWMTLPTTSGALNPGQWTGVPIQVDTTGLPMGFTDGLNLDLTWNPTVSIPFNLTVGPTAQVVLPPQTNVANDSNVTLPLDVLDIPDSLPQLHGPGLGAYQVRLFFNNTVVQAVSVAGGAIPFDGAPTSNIQNPQGFVNIAAFQAVNPDGPVGDINVANITFHAVGPANACTTVFIQVIDLLNNNADPIPNLAQHGVICILPPNTVQTDLYTGVDIWTPMTQAPDKAGGVYTAFTKVYDSATGLPLPGVLLAAYQADAYYNGMEVLAVRQQAPFDTGAELIDNPNGHTSFNGIAPLGAPWPVKPVAFLALRLTNCLGEFGLGDPAKIDIFYPQLLDVNGDPLMQENPPDTRIYLRGNAKNDNLLNVGDVLFTAQGVVGFRPYGDASNEVNAVNAASVKYDGAVDLVTMADAQRLAQRLVGLRDRCLNLIIAATPPVR